jgi:hypothetical protein
MCEIGQIAGQQAGFCENLFLPHDESSGVPLGQLCRLDAKICAPLRNRLIEHRWQLIDLRRRRDVGINSDVLARELADAHRGRLRFVDLYRRHVLQQTGRAVRIIAQQIAQQPWRLLLPGLAFFLPRLEVQQRREVLARATGL